MGKLLDQAKKLGKSKYSSVYQQIENQAKQNLDIYNTSTSQRISQLDRQIGSMSAAGASARKQIGEVVESNASANQQAIAQSQTDIQALIGRLGANQSNMLSSLQAEMKARGLTNYTEYSNLTKTTGEQNETLTAMAQLQKNALEQGALLARENLEGRQASSSLLEQTAKAGARGATQTALDDLYQTYLQNYNKIEGDKLVTEKEKKDYIYQTYLTLKDQAAQAKAEAAALAQEYAYKGAVLSETQRHNMATEANSASRLALDEAKFNASTIEAASKAVSKGGYNAANTWVKEALSTEFRSDFADNMFKYLKNVSPKMANGQPYSITSKGWTELLTGGGNQADLDRYIDKLLANASMPSTNANKSKVQSMLRQYALIANKKA